MAAQLEFVQERVALRARRDTAVLRAPAAGWRTPFGRAAVEVAHAAAGHGQVEVVGADI